ncbi:MAG TPA: hypothetical protein PLD41_03450 [Casimicrobium huifangae]|nr:hypothetical protein [Casimicrobium huifangae]
MLGLKPSRSRHVIAVAHPKHPAAAWLLYQAASDINPRVRKKRLPERLACQVVAIESCPVSAFAGRACGHNECSITVEREGPDLTRRRHRCFDLAPIRLTIIAIPETPGAFAVSRFARIFSQSDAYGTGFVDHPSHDIAGIAKGHFS